MNEFQNAERTAANDERHYCEHCGHQLIENAQYCNKCGVKITPKGMIDVRCNNCNNYVPNDSNFCHHCGSKIKNTEQIIISQETPYSIVRNITPKTQQNITPKTQQYSYAPPVSNNKRKKSNLIPLLFVGFIIMLVIIILLSAFFGSDSESDSDLTPLREPLSGTILSGSEARNGSAITISTSGSSSYVVKLKTASGTTRLSFYVRAGETVTVGVPTEKLYVYFASGDTWYGSEHLFGKNTEYAMDKTICDFTENTWEYTLYPVSDGNFRETPIDSDDFK